MAALPLALFAYLAFLFRYSHGEPMSPGPAAGLTAVFCLLYLAPTWAVLRNARLESMLLWFFSLTVVPLYLALFLATMVYGFAWVRGLPSGTAGVAAGFVVLAALFLGPPVACWLWYRALLALERALRRDPHPSA
jgi:hypothetical protein